MRSPRVDPARLRADLDDLLAIASLGILGNSLTLSVTEQLSTVGDSLTVIPHSGSGSQFGGGVTPEKIGA